MSEDTLARMLRQLEAEPDNEALRSRILQTRARIDGEQVYFEPLSSLKAWRDSHSVAKELACQAVSARLGQDYKALGRQRFECTEAFELARFQHQSTGIVLHLLPGGEYQMGCREVRFSMDRNSRPMHSVSLPAFLIGQTLVTQAQWDALGGDDSRAFEGTDMPIDSVSQANVFDWLEKAGGQLRLPSESEWEYACRANTETEFYWGTTMNLEHCWTNQNTPEQPRPVSEHFEQCNNFGLVDMLGNLWEWVEDGWIGDFESGPSSEQARSPRNPSSAVTRGGGWKFGEAYSRCCHRFQATSWGQFNSTGFRVARSL